MGFFLSKLNTLDQIDAASMRRELQIREVRCEIPHCQDVAVGILHNRIPAWICAQHSSMAELPRLENELYSTLADIYSIELYRINVAAHAQNYDVEFVPVEADLTYITSGHIAAMTLQPFDLMIP